MSYEIIQINGKEYDPYYVLDVTPDDSDDHIAKAFRIKARKYHPDKTTDPKTKRKYQKYFHIVYESYQHIIARRQALRPKANVQYDMSQNDSSRDDAKHSFQEMNRKMNNARLENDTGQRRLGDMKDYDGFVEPVINQFSSRKFSRHDFNKIFDLQQARVDKKESRLGALHRSTDGFYGYNTYDVQDYAAVASFNGLMITFDDFDKQGPGYSGYEDYKRAFDMPRNPDRVVKVPKTLVQQKTSQQEQLYRKHGDVSHLRGQHKFEEENAVLFKNNIDELVQKEAEDKEKILQSCTMGDVTFDEGILRRALDGSLEKSPSLIDALTQHYRVRKLTG